VQNHVKQRIVNPDAAVVFNKAKLAKAIHEEANAEPGGLVARSKVRTST
jgi:hypothetical protein